MYLHLCSITDGITTLRDSWRQGSVMGERRRGVKGESCPCGCGVHGVERTYRCHHPLITFSLYVRNMLSYCFHQSGFRILTPHANLLLNMLKKISLLENILREIHVLPTPPKTDF